jgi:hypothetical protein
MPLSRSFRNAAVLVALLLPATALAADSGHSDKVSFYFAAHEDDWQLFMNPSAFEDVIGAAGKTVFVHITAGDDGLGIGSGGRKQPYYLARENGALNAIRFMADADKTPIDNSTGPMTFNGHSVFRVSYLNTPLAISRGYRTVTPQVRALLGPAFSPSSVSPPEI